MVLGRLVSYCLLTLTYYRSEFLVGYFMATDKPRIQAYVLSKLYQQFEAERLTWGLSQSQALERILLERYQDDSSEQVTSDVLKARLDRVEKICNLLVTSQLQNLSPEQKSIIRISNLLGDYE